MTVQRPFRFGAQLAPRGSGEDWIAAARRVEEMGFSTLLMPDHFGDQFAPLPALMAAAAATSRLRIGSLVFDNDFKHPLVLAKEAATLDVLSGGRLEFGLGAGWLQADYSESGIPFDPPAVRIDRMKEALTIIKGHFADGPIDFKGKYYTVSGHEGTPKPVQRPRPPILIAGGGRRILRIAAREADIVGVNYVNRTGAVSPELIFSGSAAATDQKLVWLREAAGERFDEIELNATIFFAEVTNDRDGAAERIAGERSLPPTEVLRSPHFLIGSSDQIVEDLQRRREQWGFSYMTFSREAAETLAPVVTRLAGQ
ncbi:MAG: TIGR03621 family F420-dependent LLM class oxidoreductase [Dehalococcoidia bacterium]